MLTAEVIGTGRTTGEVRPARCKMGWNCAAGAGQGSRSGHYAAMEATVAPCCVPVGLDFGYSAVSRGRMGLPYGKCQLIRHDAHATQLTRPQDIRLAQAERKLAAIMLADIAGYSALMERDESRTFSRIRALREQLINPKVAEFGGRIIKTTGDGFLAEFPSATAALGCGIALQRVNFAQESNHDEAERFHMRIGINLGDIIVDGDDISGDGVNVAARLEPLAPLDGICVSGAVRDQVREDLGVILEDLGEQKVKNIERPIRAFRIDLHNAAATAVSPKNKKSLSKGLILRFVAVSVVIVGLAAYWAIHRTMHETTVAVTSKSPPANPQDRPTDDAGPLSIVVLPFTSITTKQHEAYLADGLTASVTADLSRIQNAFIIGATTAQVYRDKKLTAKQIGAELGVRFVLQGNIESDGTRIRVNAQLTDCKTNAQLWSDVFEGDTTDLFALQDKITSLIGNSLGRELVIRAAHASERSSNAPTVIDLLLQARALLLQPDSWENHLRLEELWRRVLAIEPMNVEALLGLGRTLTLQVFNYGDHQDQAARDRKIAESITLAKRAASIDPNDPVLFALQAAIAASTGDYDESSRKALMVLDQAPKWPRAYNIVGYLYVQRVEPAKACEILKRGVALDPKHPGILLANLQICEFMLGNDAAALDWGLKAKAFSFEDREILAASYARSGKLAEARNVFSGGVGLPKLSDIVNDIETDPGLWPPYRSWYKETVIPVLRSAGFPE